MWSFGNLAGKSGLLIVLLLVGMLVAVILIPQIRQFWLKLRAEEVTVTRTGSPGRASSETPLNLQIITILGKDGIPSIDNPQFVTQGEADSQMLSDERVLGVSINGDHRAYSLNMLSRHEIVNDIVGGVPIAVTW